MKPRIKVSQSVYTPSKVIGVIPNDWLKGNQFRLTILSCWLQFLDKTKTP
jgi:hypothetical protein